MYNPPAGSTYRLDYCLLADTVNSVFDNYHCNPSVSAISYGDRAVLCTGDFNIPDIFSNAISNYSSDLLEYFSNVGLLQIITTPTHKAGNVLDLCFASNPDLMDYELIEESISDHKPVLISVIGCDVSQPHNFSCSYSRSSFQYAKFNAMLDNLLFLLSTFHITDISAYSQNWHNMVSSTISDCVHRKRNRRAEFPSFYSSHTVHLANKVRTRRKQEVLDDRILPLLVSDLDVSIELDKSTYLSTFSTISPDSCFKFLRLFTKQPTLPLSMNWSDLTASGPQDVANLFNDYFISVYTVPTTTEISHCMSPDICLGELSLSVTDVDNRLSKINSFASTASDAIPPFVLSSCSSILAPYVYTLFCFLLEHRHWPCEWKCAYVTPIYKTACKTVVCNYRPISLLPRLSLVLERILYDYIFPRIRSKIHRSQHGFMRRRSTTTQLLQLCNQIYDSNDANISLDCLYFDFSKAFDSVNHSILISKLPKFGFDKAFIDFFISYLSNRTQRVRVHGCLSNSKLVTSGVPQGSVLGPLLFLIYINDLPDVILNSTIYLFADDAKLVGNLDGGLFADIERFCDWASKNNLKINAEKTKFLAFGNPPMRELIINGHVVHTSKTINDLGIVFNCTLSWNDHVSTKLRSCNRLLHAFKRHFPFNCPIPVKLRVYTACLLSVLLYGSQAWYCDNTSLRRMERFNKCCLRWVYGNHSYETILKRFSCLPISYLIIMNDLSLFYNIFHGKTDLVPTDYIEFRETRSLRTGTSRLITPKETRKFKSDRNFFVRSSMMANYLRAHSQVDITASPPIFKSKLKRYMYERALPNYCPENPCTWHLVCRCATCRT